MSESVSSGVSPFHDNGDDDADDDEVEEEEEEEEEDIYGPPLSATRLVIEDAADAEDDHPPADNYEMLDDVNDMYSLSEKMVHYVGGHILKQHWTACKYVLVFHAGAYVSSLAAMDKAKREDHVLQAYLDAIIDLDTSFFCPKTIAFFKRSFRSAEQDITGCTLWSSYIRVRKIIRNEILPSFPSDFNKMKSGRGFHETITSVLTKEFRKWCVARTKPPPISKEEASNEVLPSYWEYKHAPFTYVLATKIYRRHTQVAPDVNDVANDPCNMPMSRAERKRNDTTARNAARGGVSKKSRGDGSTTNYTIPSVVDVCAESLKQGKRDHRKERTAATAQVRVNLEIRLGRMHELKSQLDIYERYKSLMSDEEYALKAKKVLACLPDPETYMTEVSTVSVEPGIEEEGEEQEEDEE
jgi:hypothetical protein